MVKDVQTIKYLSLREKKLNVSYWSIDVHGRHWGLSYTVFKESHYLGFLVPFRISMDTRNRDYVIDRSGQPQYCAVGRKDARMNKVIQRYFVVR